MSNQDCIDSRCSNYDLQYWLGTNEDEVASLPPASLCLLQASTRAKRADASGAIRHRHKDRTWMKATSDTSSLGHCLSIRGLRYYVNRAE